MAQMKEQFKAPEKIQLSNKEIANYQIHSSKHWLSGCSRNSWILRQHKKDPGNSEGKETWTQINSLEQKEEKNIQPEQNEETRIQKNEDRLRNLQDIFKHSNMQIIGIPEGEEEEQKIENLF